MRFFHTLWTKPATIYNRCGASNILTKSIWYYALSYLYVRKTFPNAKIVADRFHYVRIFAECLRKCRLDTCASLNNDIK